jgi:anhydro-N-acetylmuramic acid kinase
VYHQGAPGAFLGAPRVASTLQIGEPSVIAELTGIPVVADFRPADVAAHGQGAPLVPFVDYLLYRHPRFGRVALNIGGIANVTVVPRAARPEQLFAFDTGPGNMLMDGLARHNSHGRLSCDRDARLARRGHLLPALLAEMLRDPYFSRRPPKSCGREQYGDPYLHRVLKWGRTHKARAEDLLHTATVFTAVSIVDALRRFVFPRAAVHQLIVAGGGAQNPLLMAQLEAGLRSNKEDSPQIHILPSTALGVPEDAKEAFAFAILAYESFHGRPANLPSATGARHPVVLGKLSRPFRK